MPEDRFAQGMFHSSFIGNCSNIPGVRGGGGARASACGPQSHRPGARVLKPKLSVHFL